MLQFCGFLTKEGKLLRVKDKSKICRIRLEYSEYSFLEITNDTISSNDSRVFYEKFGTIASIILENTDTKQQKDYIKYIGSALQGTYSIINLSSDLNKCTKSLQNKFKKLGVPTVINDEYSLYNLLSFYTKCTDNKIKEYIFNVCNSYIVYNADYHCLNYTVEHIDYKTQFSDCALVLFDTSTNSKVVIKDWFSNLIKEFNYIRGTDFSAYKEHIDNLDLSNDIDGFYLETTVRGEGTYRQLTYTNLFEYELYVKSKKFL